MEVHGGSHGIPSAAGSLVCLELVKKPSLCDCVLTRVPFAQLQLAPAIPKDKLDGLPVLSFHGRCIFQYVDDLVW